MASEVHQPHRGRRQPPRRLLAHQGEHAAVVVGIGVDVEQVRPGGVRQRGDGGAVTTLGDVDDALEHGARLPSPAPTATLPSVNLGAPELIIILLVILLLFGGAKLPKLARSLGQAQKEFKQGLNESADDKPSDGPIS